MSGLLDAEIRQVSERQFGFGFENYNSLMVLEELLYKSLHLTCNVCKRPVIDYIVSGLVKIIKKSLKC